MSQPQVQQKIAVVNGLNRRRGDQDLGNSADAFRKEYNRSSRSGSSSHGRTEGGGHQHGGSNTSVNQPNNLHKDKGEVTTLTETRGGNQGPWNHLHLTACLVGQSVEVQVKCGSIYSGVFHTANAEKDHGIVLRMARIIKDGSIKGKADPQKELALRPHKKMIIYAKDFVQIIAKDVPLRGERLQNGRVRENRAEMLTDSLLSQGRHGDLDRELKPWTPDATDSRGLGLESTFDNTWNRNWDQFEINRTLFGVESTFDEELYTTKLEKGPQMREREREASRIAREIEEQTTKNYHVAEERGARLSKDFLVMDEESRFSSVLRVSEDRGEDMEDLNIDSHNDETFGGSQNHSAGVPAGDDLNNEIESGKFPADVEKDLDSASIATHTSGPKSSDKKPEEKSPHVVIGDRPKHSLRVGVFSSPRPSSLLGDTASLQALNLDPGSPHLTEDVYREFNEFKQKRGKQQREDQVNELKSFSKSLKDLTVVRQQGAATTGSSRKTAAAYAPPASALPLPTSITNPTSTCSGSDSSLPQGQIVPMNRGIDSTRVEGAFERPSMSSTPSSNLELPISPMNSTASTTVPSSPSSSDISSSSSLTKKSSLNPNAKEFKLNPHAKSFTPNFTPLRPPSSIVQGSTYVPGMVTQATPMQNVPLGVPGNAQTQQVGQPAAKYTTYNSAAVSGASGALPFLPPPPAFVGGQAPMKVPSQLQQQPVGGNSYGPQQPIRYNPPPMMQSMSTYMHPSGHMYSQQMMFGQAGQVVYYQPYPQGLPMPPPQPTSAPSPQLAANRGMIQDMQMCMAPPYIAGQQHYLPPVQIPQLPTNPGQPVSGPSNMQTQQGVAGGMMPQALQTPGGIISNSSVMRVGAITGVTSAST